MTESIHLNNVSMQQSNGPKATMPEARPVAELLVALNEFNKYELYTGTGEGVQPIVADGAGTSNISFDVPQENASSFRGTFVYFDNDDNTWKPAYAQASSNLGEHYTAQGIAVSIDSTSMQVTTSGKLTIPFQLNDFTGTSVVAGSYYYLCQDSSNAGMIQAEEPSSGIKQVVCQVMSVDETQTTLLLLNDISDSYTKTEVNELLERINSLPIGTIYQAIRTDIPEGSLRLDGTEFTTGFEGFVTNYLATGKVICKTYDEWQTEYTMTNGNVGFFAYDSETGKFKTPCIQAGTFLAQAITSGEFGSFLASSLKSHTHSWSGTTSSNGAHTHTRGTMNITGDTGQRYYDNYGISGAFYKGTSHSVLDASSSSTNSIAFNASKSWTGATSSNGAHTHTVSGTTGGTGGSDTYPKHIKYPFFVVVSNVAAEEPSQVAWDNFVGNLDGKANKSDVVSKLGDTMSGNLNLHNQASTSVLGLKHSHIVSQNPSSTINYGYLGFFDGNNTHLGGVATMQNTSGVVTTYLRSSYNTDYQITVSNNGVTSCPTPATGDNSTKIATTAYCVNMRCTTKATTTSSASITRPCWVVQNYVNGTSWYRVWSDGWIEQGGLLTTNKSTAYFTVNFIKTMTTTNYDIQLTPGWATSSSGNDYATRWAYDSLTTSSMKVASDNDATYLRWTIQGY